MGDKPRQLVIFDLDNVIISGQSQLVLLKYLFLHGYAGIVPLLKISGWYLLYRLRIFRHPEKIGRYAFSFLAGRRVAQVEAVFDKFFRQSLRHRIFPGIAGLIGRHEAAGREILIVSSACDLIVAKTAAHLGVKKYIATALERENGRYTGRTVGPLVYGREKLARAAELMSRAETWVYTDHISDLPLLEAADHPSAVNPCRRLRRLAHAAGWPVVTLGMSVQKGECPGSGSVIVASATLDKTVRT